MFAYENLGFDSTDHLDRVGSSAWSLPLEGDYVGNINLSDNQWPEEGQFMSGQQQTESLNSLHDDAYGSIPYGTWVPFIPPTPPNPDSAVDEGSPPHQRVVVPKKH